VELNPPKNLQGLLFVIFTPQPPRTIKASNTIIFLSFSHPDISTLLQNQADLDLVRDLLMLGSK
jgi:hypothetical protein